MFKRPKSSLLRLSFSILSTLVLFLSACGAQGTPAQTSSQPVKGGTWIDDVPAAPGSLLPQGSDTTYSVLIDQAIYTPLFYGDALGHIHPGLAVDIPTVANGEASADLKTWTFKLKPNLKWSDGQPLNADDLAYSFKTFNDPAFGEKFTTGFADITSTDVSPINSRSLCIWISRSGTLSPTSSMLILVPHCQCINSPAWHPATSSSLLTASYQP